MIERQVWSLGGWGGGKCFLREEGGREYIYLDVQGDKIHGNPVSFKENHLSCRVKITGYIWFTLNWINSKTPSFDMRLNKSSIMARVWFALLFFLSNFQLCTILIRLYSTVLILLCCTVFFLLCCTVLILLYSTVQFCSTYCTVLVLLSVLYGFCCTVLYLCVVLYSTFVLYCTVPLCCTVLYLYIVLYCTCLVYCTISICCTVLH